MPDWHPVRDLARRVKMGERLTLTDDVIAILRRSADEVAITSDEVSTALRTIRTATALLRKISKRIGDGSDRLTRALNQMYRLRDAGDLEGARQQMRDVLAVEVVPLYRDIAQGQLEKLDRWKPPTPKQELRKTPPRKARSTKVPSGKPTKVEPSRASAEQTRPRRRSGAKRSGRSSQ